MKMIIKIRKILHAIVRYFSYILDCYSCHCFVFVQGEERDGGSSMAPLFNNSMINQRIEQHIMVCGCPCRANAASFLLLLNIF